MEFVHATARLLTGIAGALDYDHNNDFNSGAIHIYYGEQLLAAFRSLNDRQFDLSLFDNCMEHIPYGVMTITVRNVSQNVPDYVVQLINGAFIASDFRPNFKDRLKSTGARCYYNAPLAIEQDLRDVGATKRSYIPLDWPVLVPDSAGHTIIMNSSDRPFTPGTLTFLLATTSQDAEIPAGLPILMPIKYKDDVITIDTIPVDKTVAIDYQADPGIQSIMIPEINVVLDQRFPSTVKVAIAYAILTFYNQIADTPLPTALPTMIKSSIFGLVRVLKQFSKAISDGANLEVLSKFADEVMDVATNSAVLDDYLNEFYGVTLQHDVLNEFYSFGCYAFAYTYVIAKKTKTPQLLTFFNFIFESYRVFSDIYHSVSDRFIMVPVTDSQIKIIGYQATVVNQPNKGYYVAREGKHAIVMLNGKCVFDTLPTREETYPDAFIQLNILNTRNESCTPFLLDSGLYEKPVIDVAVVNNRPQVVVTNKAYVSQKVDAQAYPRNNAMRKTFPTLFQDGNRKAYMFSIKEDFNRDVLLSTKVPYSPLGKDDLD